MKLFFVVNHPDFLISHRLDICLESQRKGWDIHIICPQHASIIDLIKLGFSIHIVEFGRNRINPFLELKTLLKLTCIFKKFKPDLVHLITVKPYLYGGIAARIAGIKSVVSAVAGLGILFSSSNLKYSVIRLCLFPIFKYAFNHQNQTIIFQNSEDRMALLNWGVINDKNVQIIRGSGVRLASCSVVSEPEAVPVIAFAARLLKDKGVEIFIRASRILNERNIAARFWLIGEPAIGNANSVTQSQLDDWEKEGLVELFGFRNDIPDLFAQVNIVTLPSFYGEGLPKVLIEAAACGRAVITTDHPGCRDAIEADLTGLLVPVRDAVALANAIQDLIENPDKRKVMGKAGRELAEKEFAIEKVVDAHLKIYDDLLLKVSK